MLSLVNPESKNPIFEYECLAILGALKLWGDLVCGSNVVIFADSEGALSCMISATSQNFYGQAIAEHVHQTCDAHFLNAWLEHVNTSSNIADAPSRGVSCPQLGNKFEICFDDVTEHAFESWGF